MPIDTSNVRLTTRWATLGSDVIDRQKANEERIKRTKPNRKEEYSNLSSYQRLLQSGRMREESMERALRYYFDHCPMRLGYMQELALNVFTIGILKQMYGKDLVANLAYLQSKYLIQRLVDAYSILFPRRCGKSEVAAFFYALMVISQPHCHCIMYNLTSRQAEEFLACVMKHMAIWKDDAEFGYVVTRQNILQMIKIRSNKYDTNNSVKSYPSALKGKANIGPMMMTSNGWEIS